jgi:hypothetical protein
MLRGVTVAGIAALALAVGATPASAGDDLRVRVAKQKHGNYKTTTRANFSPREVGSFWFRVENLGAQELEPTFSDSGSSDQDGYRTRWFKAGKNISQQVEGAGRDFTIDPGQRKYFNAVHTAPVMPGSTCLKASVTDSTSSDAAGIGINGGQCAF